MPTACRCATGRCENFRPFADLRRAHAYCPMYENARRSRSKVVTCGDHDDDTEPPMSKQKDTGAAFLAQQKKRLMAMRDRIVGSTSSSPAPKFDEAKEREDDAQDMAQSEVDGTIDAIESQRLGAIERALAKIAEGTYGLSDLSGDPIPRARLEALPEALFTIEEEAAREKQQR